MSCFDFLKKKPKFEPPREPGLQHLGPDPFIESPYVVGLDPPSYPAFIQSKDASLIMFYNPFKKACETSAKHFAKAAKKSSRDYGYAGFDCSKHSDFCGKLKVDVLPYFKAFSQGRNINNYREEDYHFEEMRRWIERLPKGGSPVTAIEEDNPAEHIYEEVDSAYGGSVYSAPKSQYGGSVHSAQKSEYGGSVQSEYDSQYGGSIYSNAPSEKSPGKCPYAASKDYEEPIYDNPVITAPIHQEDPIYIDILPDE